MAKNWYPVIDFEECIECGVCLNKCKNGVYENENGKPVVVAPDNCIDGCRGCQKLCPAGAIEYVGDTSEDKGEGCSCGGCCC